MSNMKTALERAMEKAAKLGEATEEEKMNYVARKFRLIESRRFKP